MAVIEGRTWLELVPEEECWRLLAEAERGRVGVLVDGMPEIFPVNHVVDHRTLLFRTDPGSKLTGLRRHPMVCFEIDGELPGHAAWSVLVKGRAVEQVSAEAVRRATALSLTSWAKGDKIHWIRIDPVEVSGRRIRSGSAKGAALVSRGAAPTTG